MCMYTSSRGKINRCHSKSEFQMFSLTSRRHVVGTRSEGYQQASPLKICVERFGKLLKIGVPQRPEMWRSCLLINLS